MNKVEVIDIIRSYIRKVYNPNANDVNDTLMDIIEEIEELDDKQTTLTGAGF